MSQRKRSYRSNRRDDAKHHAKVTWTTQDLLNNWHVTEKEAALLLKANEFAIQNAMLEAGWRRLHALMLGFTRKPGGIYDDNLDGPRAPGGPVTYQTLTFGVPDPWEEDS